MAATDTVTLLILAPWAVPQLIGTRSYQLDCLYVLIRFQGAEASKATIPGAGTGAETAP